MKIGLIQYNPVWEDKEKNKEKLEALLSENLSDSRCLIFPELSLTGFTMKSNEFGERLNGSSSRFFANLAVKYNADIFAGLIEEENEKYFNTLLHIQQDGEVKTSYRKIHPFTYSTEDEHYEKGSKTVVTEINGWKIGLSICYDLRFPELFRQYAKQRVHLIFCIANWPDTRIEHWRALLKARAIENQCYVAGVNRVGKDPKLSYNGFSSIIDPMGKEIASSEDEERIVKGELSLDYVNEIREKLPFLDDIRLI